MICPSTHPSAQLMQLRQAHALWILNHHQRGIGNIDAHFYHRCGNEKLKLAGLEASHDSGFVAAFQAPVEDADRNSG